MRPYLRLVVPALVTCTLLALLPASALGADSVRVKTDKGAVRGKVTKTGQQFLGIPYAKPPVGDRRWRAPAAAAKFRKTLDARRLRSECLQDKTEVADRRKGSEDCLYLNVYRPRGKQRNLPVMVWYHGGAFINGSGNIYDGRLLANTAKAIVVTVNYRLGPFGWLALPGLAAERKDGSTGNYGLMDQQASLRWVKRNIKRFGGAPRNVTVFGQSAGGEAGFAHLTSPRSRGLFAKVIVQSSPATLRFPTKPAAYEKYEPVAVRAGCPRSAQQIACLRKASGSKVLTAADESWDIVERLGLDWTPTNDGVIQPKAFQTMLAEGRFARVPVMVGATRDEGKLFFGIYENNNRQATTDAQLFERNTTFFSRLSGLPPSVTAGVTRTTLARYPKSNPLYRTAGLQGAAGITDALFTCTQASLRDSLAGRVPTWGYEFNDPKSPPVEINAKYIDLGSAHDSELPYLFQINPDTGRPSRLTKSQRALGVRMGQYWGRFARTGNPNGTGLPKWAAWKADTGQVQSLRPGATRSLAAGAFRRQHQCDYWDPLLKATFGGD